MPDMAQINETTLAQLLSEHFEIDSDQLRPNATLEELELDSLAMMELVVVIEERTGLELGEENLDLGPASTLADAAQALARAVAEAHAGTASAQGSALR